MAYGNELHLGFVHGKDGFDASLFRALGAPLLHIGDAEGADYDVVDSLENVERWQETPEVKAICARLREAHRQALVDMGFKLLKSRGRKAAASNSDEYVHAETPLGPREFHPWSLSVNWDPNEMEETEEQALISVAISGRYFPTFADWKSEHGTLYPVVFDADMARAQEIARRRIVEVLPCFTDAVWIVKEQHY